MTPLCPKCGREVKYIASPSVRENKIYTVDAGEKRLLALSGRIIVGFQEHICTSPDKPVEGADVKKDAENHTG